MRIPCQKQSVIMPSSSTLQRHSPRAFFAQFSGPVLLTLTLLIATSCGSEPPVRFTETETGVAYANEVITDIPWSIHIVRIDRGNPGLSLHSVHAQGNALGLETVSQQIQRAGSALGVPVAAVNGDFYQRERAYAGDPRGLQIADGELLSAPNGGVSFWLDAAGKPQIAAVATQFQAIWPDSTTTPFGLNEERKPDGLVLYSPSLGASTHTIGGRELVLLPEGGSSSLHLGDNFRAKVHEIRETGDTSLKAGTLVLSAGPALMKQLPKLDSGAVVMFSTTTQPALNGTRTAIGGGPVLVKQGHVQKIRPPSADSYEFSSMIERHPRTALGWNDKYLFLVEVDGRQKQLSVGMTLEELAGFLKRLGCEEAMNLDGGGSATLWFDGQVRNRPCDGSERPVANALLVTRKVNNQP
jgi:hypothetical protein